MQVMASYSQSQMAGKSQIPIFFVENKSRWTGRCQQKPSNTFFVLTPFFSCTTDCRPKQFAALRIRAHICLLIRNAVDNLDPMHFAVSVTQAIEPIISWHTAIHIGIAPGDRHFVRQNKKIAGTLQQKREMHNFGAAAKSHLMSHLAA